MFYVVQDLGSSYPKSTFSISEKCCAKIELKNIILNISEQTESTNWTTEENINYPFNDIISDCSSYKNSSAECLELCKDVVGCIGFSWHSPLHDYCPKGCWLKSQMENREKETHVISGFINIGNEGNIIV